MISTSEEYKTAIKAAERDIKPKVEIYFDGDDAAPTILGSDGIESVDVLEELQAEGANPLGAASSNELFLSLRNDEDEFNPNNAAGPFYGKLVPYIKIKPYYGVKLPNTTYEYIPMGVFRAGDWNAPSDEAFASVTCYDKLFEIGEMDVPLIPVMQNITQYEMFETLFQALGLSPSEYEIDVTLTTVVPIAYYPDSKVRDALTIMAASFNCTVIADRTGKLKVINNKTVGSSVVTFRDTEDIWGSDAPQVFENIYTDITVKYHLYAIGEKATVLSLPNVLVESSGLSLEGLRFTTAPLAIANSIRLIDSAHILASDVSLGAWGMDIILVNEGSADKYITLEVEGYPLEETIGEITVRDDTAYALIKRAKPLVVDSYLLQSAAHANAYINLVKPIVTDPAAYVQCPTRGDPSVELGDVATVHDATNNLGPLDIVPLRYDYRYSGGLSCDIFGIKKSAREGA